MEVTDVRVRKLHMPNESGSKMRAIVSVTFDGEFVVHDIKVIQGEEKYFIAMPSRKVEDGTYKDITHPIRSSLREKIQTAVLARYEQALDEAEAANAEAVKVEAANTAAANAEADKAETAVSAVVTASVAETTVGVAEATVGVTDTTVGATEANVNATETNVESGAANAALSAGSENGEQSE